ncbi:uncharacterized protein LTHEOB_12835 [Lasiodiplodia theobromae]|uniref:uncharacterized protein n=1 Tax=Lasiodiplodia theobromae TaxID=45133 RepID=UPI0015C366E7|nr:uncharacterized protein LTHEOB_12835 [Lasiodiplodia theobromae]KAF4535098.1 hypothetical protein LTHEOB_12835 [Lasiodiplodia theobromae]
MSGFEISAAITSAPGLFLACVECFELIQLGRSFGKDFERSLLRLRVTKLRFVRIGSCKGIALDNPEATLPERMSDDEGTEETVKKLIAQIITQFSTTSSICDRYKGDDKSVGEAGDVKDENILQLLQKVHDQAQIRQNRTNFRRKVAWVCYEKGHLDRMLDSINIDINNLSYFLETGNQENQHAIQEVNTIKTGAKDPDSLLSILKEVADGTDAALRVAAGNALDSGGHRYQNNYLEKCDNVTYGDWVGSGATASAGGGKNLYRGNQAKEVKNLVYGTHYQGNTGT